jgi:predicted lactoylglutathione lyase
MDRRLVFVNLCVRDLPRTISFFEALGFAFDPRFTNAQGACMVIAENASYAMLLSEPFFRTFTKREPCDTARGTEAITCIMVESREAVDALCDRALAQGGAEAMPPQDHGAMYNRSFYDLDGHHWEVGWMDAAALAAMNAGASHEAPPQG